MTPHEFLREQIIDEARTYIDVPWRHMGRSRFGIDCVGLVVLVGRAIGLHEYPDNMGYSRIANGAKLLDPFRQFSAQIGILKALPGDVIVMKDRLFPHHCGIISERNGEPTLIHATLVLKRVAEEGRVHALQRNPAISAFRFNFLADEGEN